MTTLPPHLPVVGTAACFCVLLCGCSTVRLYDGPRLEPGREARIETTAYVKGLHRGRTHLSHIDGKPVDRSKKSFIIIPGDVTVTVYRQIRRNYQTVTSAAHSLSFQACGGHLYHVDSAVVPIQDHPSRWDYWRTFYWIEDNATGQQVAGQKPSTRNP